MLHILHQSGMNTWWKVGKSLYHMIDLGGAIYDAKQQRLINM